MTKAPLAQFNLDSIHQRQNLKTLKFCDQIQNKEENL